MIIVELNGGLGNQLFQYAFGRNLSLTKNTKLALNIFNISSYNHAIRSFALSPFNIKAEIINDAKDIPKIGLLKRFVDLFKSSDKRTIAKGYWQSEKYFRNIEQTIRQDLTLKEKQNETFNNILLQIESCTSISLHIRRTDYLISKHRQIYNICSKEYYEQALKIITNKVSDRSKLFVFSDDINWVKNNLTFSVPTIFVSDNGFKDYQDLILMSTCKHNITANSTLSWWGAWLNGNKGKIVITPEKWYLNSKIDNKDLIPETWIRV